MSTSRIASCIGLVYLTAFGVPAGAHAFAAMQNPPKLSAAPDPDELYRNRADFTLAQQAIAIWTERATSGRDFDAAWKLARARYYLGTIGPEAERRGHLELGIAAGRMAADLQPAKPDGHFWYAANMGEVAQTGSLFAGLKYKASVKSELEKVIAMAPGWQSGSAESALGQWYVAVPANVLCCGGDRAKGLDLLRRGLAYNTTNIQAKFALAEALSDDKSTREDARQLLRQVLDGPIDPDWAPEDRRCKQRAGTLLTQLTRK